ncbi:synaptobrevin [Basidiobolus meristosporus CBS 931.73]|uniref:Synaptobrevin n=1 Tax=Basidiobolus meristosporus CBS 931.73 TaxID=1314790 RepID=A0A1Y1YU17_9FUNG|nr:synaptobrevin [Basidiobolus meristosporus CBS 931.73]|eukprot:ORY01533.1 synaptobrevin [Basidiobolus meristosporus CBS 931.73]
MSAANVNQAKLVQQQVDDVVNIMQENVNRVMERGECLDSMNDKADDLEAGAQQFRRGVNHVRQRMWRKNLKMKIIIAAIVLLLLVIIIGECF